MNRWALALACFLALAAASPADAVTIVSADLDFGNSGPLAGVTTSIAISFDESLVPPTVNDVVGFGQ